MGDINLPEPLVSGNVSLDGALYRNGDKVAILGSRQAQLLRILIRAANRPVLIEDLYFAIYEGDYDPDNVRVQMSLLRGRIEDNPQDPRLLRTMLSGQDRCNSYILVTDDKLAELLDRRYDGFGHRRTR